MPLGAGRGRSVEQGAVAASDERSQSRGQSGGCRVLVLRECSHKIGEHRGRAGMGARVGGDARGGVGGEHGAVERGGRRRVERPAEQHADERVHEQGATGEGVRPGGQVERVEPHTRRPEMEVGAADSIGKAAVFVFGVDHETWTPA